MAVLSSLVLLLYPAGFFLLNNLPLIYSIIFKGEGQGLRPALLGVGIGYAFTFFCIFITKSVKVVI